MSIFIIGASGAITSAPACIIETEVASEMGPAIQNISEISLGTVEESVVSIVASSNRPSVRQHVSNRESKANHTAYHGYANCYGLPYQDHNYGAPPPRTPPPPSPKVDDNIDEDTGLSLLSNTSTNNEEENAQIYNPPQSTESITRCICGFNHDDEYMICCDKCFVWQHVDCMGLDRTNMPETYLCECCQPRKVDKQKAKALQTRKKEEMTADSSSDETGEEVTTSGINGHPLMLKSGKIKRRRKDKIAERQHRRIKKERDVKKIKGRRRTKSRSENSNAVDEESQDAWDYSLQEWTDKYEKAVLNQYDPDVQNLMSSLKLNGQNDEFIRKTLNLLGTKLCRVGLVEEGDSSIRGLLAVQDIASDHAIIEYCGKFLSLAQFKEHNPVFNKSHAYVLFHKALPNGEQVCVDAREYGNDARFVRRSANPNAVVRHLIQNGTLHLYLFSCCKIPKGQEISIPFDNLSEGNTESACLKEACSPVLQVRRNSIKDCSEKRRKNKRQSMCEEDCGPVVTVLSIVPPSPIKVLKSSPVKQEIIDMDDCEISSTVNSDLTIESAEVSESEKQLAERQKKMTREERKIDAYMRAFERMEKMAKKRQQNQEKIASLKAQHPGQEQELPVEKDEDGSSLPSTLSASSGAEAAEDHSVQQHHVSLFDQSLCTPPVLALPIKEEIKPSTLNASASNKPKKGKRRRGSGSVVKRRVRTSSGGSDIMLSEELSYVVPPLLMCPQNQQQGSSFNSSSGSMSGGILMVHQNSNSCSSPFSAPSPTLLMGAPSPMQGEVTSFLSSPTGISAGPVGGESIFPKSKRFLMHEWMQEKAESAVPPTYPLSVRTELGWTLPTCYVRCTKDAPNYGGISASLLRRNSASGSRPSLSHGSAKKRWLRQALTDDKTPDGGDPVEYMDIDHSSPLDSSYCLSPGTHGDASNQSPPDDLITPLKKRRLMRESLDSTSPSLLSPSTTDRPASTVSWADGSPEYSSFNIVPVVRMRCLDEVSTDSSDIRHSHRTISSSGFLPEKENTFTTDKDSSNPSEKVYLYPPEKDCPHTDNDYPRTPDNNCPLTPEKDCHYNPEKECHKTPLKVYHPTPEKDCPRTPEKDCPRTPEKDCPRTPEKDCPLTPEKDCPRTPEKDCPRTPEKDCPRTPEKDCPRTPEKDCPRIPEKNCPRTPEKDCPRTPEKDCPRTPEKDCPCTVEEDNPRTAEKNNPRTPEKDNPHTSEKDNSLTPEKDNSLTPEKDYPHTWEKDCPGTPEKDCSLTPKKHYPRTPEKNSPRTSPPKDFTCTPEKNPDKDFPHPLNESSYRLEMDRALSLEKESPHPLEMESPYPLESESFYPPEKSPHPLEKDSPCAPEKVCENLHSSDKVCTSLPDSPFHPYKGCPFPQLKFSEKVVDSADTMQEELLVKVVENFDDGTAEQIVVAHEEPVESSCEIEQVDSNQTLPIPKESAERLGRVICDLFEKSDKCVDLLQADSSSVCDTELRTTQCESATKDLVVTSSSVTCSLDSSEAPQIVPCSENSLKVDANVPPNPVVTQCEDFSAKTFEPSIPDSSGQRVNKPFLESSLAEEDEATCESAKPSEIVHEVVVRASSPDTTKYFAMDVQCAITQCVENQVSSSSSDCSPSSANNACVTPSDSSVTLSDVNSVYGFSSPVKLGNNGQSSYGSNGSSVVSSSTPGHKRKVSLFEYRLRMRDSTGSKTGSSSEGSCLPSPSKERPSSPPDRWSRVALSPSPEPAPPPPPPRSQQTLLFSLASSASDKILNSSPVKAALELIRVKRERAEEKLDLMKEGGENEIGTVEIADTQGYPIPVSFSKKRSSQKFITQISMTSYPCEGSVPPPPPPQGQPIPVLCSRVPSVPLHMMSLVGPRAIVNQPSNHFNHHSPSAPPPPPPPPPQQQLSSTVTSSSFGQTFSSSGYPGVNAQMVYKESGKNQA